MAITILKSEMQNSGTYSNVSGIWMPGILIPTILDYIQHPKTGLVWFSNGRFVSGCRMVPYSNVKIFTSLDPFGIKNFLMTGY
jgi:hypothetical protein